MTEKAPLWEPFYPASFSTPCVTSVFRRKPLFRTGHRTRQIWLICEWDLGLAWLANLQKSRLSKHPSKTAQRGLVCEQGSVSLLRRRKPHTGPYRWDCGDYPALLPTGLRDFFFFWAHPQSPFLCLCGAVFIQEAPSFDPPNNVL